MEIPDFIKSAKSGDIIATRHNHLLMVERVEIENNHLIRIFPFFHYTDKNGVVRNEWLYGFYGPCNAIFYREATASEKELFMRMIRKCGYEMYTCGDKIVPFYMNCPVVEGMSDHKSPL